MNGPTLVQATPTDQTSGRSPQLAGDYPSLASQSSDVSGDLLLTDQRGHESHHESVGQQLLATDQVRIDSHISSVGGDHLVGGQGQLAPQSSVAPDEPSADSQAVSASQESCAVSNSSNQPPTLAASPTNERASDGWLELRIWAEMFHDAQQQRIASVNRAERGGVDPALYVAYIESVERAENTARLGMVRCYRRVVPTELRQWQQSSRGIGEHQMARLLGHLGDPYIAIPHHWEGTGDKRILIADDPFVRTVSQLWSYCGHGDSTRRRTRGMTVDEAFALGKPLAKSLLFQIAESCMKAGGEYRLVYDQRRLDTADRVHAVACVRCGPSGKPASEGTPWSKAHQHADALRVLGKEVLRDMWLTRRNTEMAVAA